MMQRRRSRKFVAEINVVPYIDVMLVLLIIFMITTPLLTQGVKIDLPKAEAKALEQQNKQPIVVTVNKKGQYFLNVAPKPSTPLTEKALKTLVAGQVQLAQTANIHRDILIRGDQSVGYGKVVYAMTLLQQAGVDNIGLITEPPGGADKA